MFRKAYHLANKYTKPFIVAMRFFDQRVEVGLGSFVLINKDGWMMTAAHNFGVAFGFNEHKSLIQSHQEKTNAILNNNQIHEVEKKKMLQQLQPNKNWITHFSFLVNGQPNAILENYIYGEHDLALFRINPAVLDENSIYPKFINPKHISPGTSLCKLGFPFVEVKATFDERTQQFVFPKNLLPLPLFPMEGIYTRNMHRGMSGDGIDILFLETSSPGVKGQSGGPMFDTAGNIYAIQSQNMTVNLGYKGTIEENGLKIEENQFLNVGIGVHPLTIEKLLQKHGIKYERAEIVD